VKARKNTTAQTRYARPAMMPRAASPTTTKWTYMPRPGHGRTQPKPKYVKWNSGSMK
jgi:hypothetical protein